MLKLITKRSTLVYASACEAGIRAVTMLTIRFANGQGARVRTSMVGRRSGKMRAFL
jgi:hypothetical protein